MGTGFTVLTISTLMPFDNIGVMTMKMMSSTSITSTMGVTLMSATGGGDFSLKITDIVEPPVQAGSGASRREPGRPGESRDAPTPLFNSPSKSTGQEACPTTKTDRLKPVLPLLTRGGPLRPLQEVVDQLGAGVAHLHVEGFNLAREVVEHPDRGDSHEKSDSRGHQGLGNTAGHGAQTGGLLGRNSLERVDDAHHRSEQSHEGGCRTNGRQAADTALQFGMHDGFGALQGPLRGLDVIAGNFRTHLVSLKLLQSSHHHFGEVALLVPVGDLDRFVQLAFF